MTSEMASDIFKNVLSSSPSKQGKNIAALADEDVHTVRYWLLDDGIGDMLPVMQSDIHFQKENTVLIIDAKYYTNTTQVQFDKHTLHSNNLYQIFTYVKNREYQFGDEENKVSGMLLYARTDALIQPDNVYQMHGNQISVKTLDLNKPFDEIAKQLDEIAAAHFDGIEKTIQRKNNDK